MDESDALAFFTSAPELPAEEDREIVHSVSQVEVLPDGRVERAWSEESGGFGPDYLILPRAAAT